MVSPGDLRWRCWEEGWRLLEINLCPKRPQCPPRPHLTAPPPPIPPPPTGPGGGTPSPEAWSCHQGNPGFPPGERL